MGEMPQMTVYYAHTNDREGGRRLRQVAKACTDVGHRVQNSVFECSLDHTQFAISRFTLASLIDLRKDSLRFYLLGTNWRCRLEHSGARSSHEPEGVMIT